MADVLRTQFAVNFALSIQYRGSAVMWTVTGFLSQLMALAIWTQVADERGGSVGGYDHGDLVTYFVASHLMVALSATWAAWKLSEGVRTGSLSPELLRPMPPWVGWFAEIFSFKLVMLVIQVPALVLAALALGASTPQAAATMLVAPLAVALTMALRFAIDICIGSSSFWFTDMRGVAGTFFLAYMLLSGSFAPVALLPPVLRSLAEHSPFYYMLGFPVDLATGRLTPAQVADGVVLQVAWSVAAVALAMLLWRRGLRRYSAVGA